MNLNSIKKVDNGEDKYLDSIWILYFVSLNRIDFPLPKTLIPSSLSKMDIEQKQSELIDHFVKRASAASDAAALSSVLVEATSHPSLFAFSEILALTHLYSFLFLYLFKLLALVQHLSKLLDCIAFSNSFVRHLRTAQMDDLHLSIATFNLFLHRLRRFFLQGWTWTNP